LLLLTKWFKIFAVVSYLYYQLFIANKFSTWSLIFSFHHLSLSFELNNENVWTYFCTSSMVLLWIYLIVNMMCLVLTEIGSQAEMLNFAFKWVIWKSFWLHFGFKSLMHFEFTLNFDIFCLKWHNSLLDSYSEDWKKRWTMNDVLNDLIY